MRGQTNEFFKHVFWSRKPKMSKRIKWGRTNKFSIFLSILKTVGRGSRESRNISKFGRESRNISMRGQIYTFLLFLKLSVE